MANNTSIAQAVKIHEALISRDQLKTRFEDILKENSGAYMASVLNIIKSNDQLASCEPASVWNAALCAAAMKLPIEPNLGYAYIIPYKTKEKDANGENISLGQFQMGYKGYKQLALRTGEYIVINATDVREGEIKHRDRLSGRIDFEWIDDEADRESREIIGYVSYFMLNNGFSSTLYMSVEQLREHARKYSKMYQADLKYGSKKSKWSTAEDFPAMCLKTVTKLNLSKNGPLSVEMQKAIACDNASIDEHGNPSKYVDNTVEGEFEETDASAADKLTQELSKEGAFDVPMETPEEANIASEENEVKS